MNFSDGLGGETDSVSFFFCDTTLRYGELLSGKAYTAGQKIEIAQKLSDIGIEFIDFGFMPTSMEGESALRVIAELDLSVKVMVMSSINKKSIDRAIQCGVTGIILSIPGSDTGLRATYGGNIINARRALEKESCDAVRYAKDNGLLVEFRVEDATRAIPSFLPDILGMGEGCGADFVGITDTVGCYTPEKMYSLIKKIGSIIRKPVGVHCYSKSGLATANTIAGLMAGAAYCGPSVNGMNERSGNASIEQILLILKVLYNLDFHYDRLALGELSQMIQEMNNPTPSTGFADSIPFTTETAFHTAGPDWHWNRIGKERLTCEILNPILVSQKQKATMEQDLTETMEFFPESTDLSNPVENSLLENMRKNIRGN